MVPYCVAPPRISHGVLVRSSPGTAPVTVMAPAAGGAALIARVANVSGWPTLLVRLALMSHDQSPLRLPSEALAWFPSNVRSVPYSLKDWPNALTLAWASNRVGMRVT